MKIAIVGSRNYPQLEEVRKFVRTLPRSSTIVSGGAVGVDSVAVDEAKKLGLNVKVFDANWEKDKTCAGFLRNKKVVAYADRCVAFQWKNSPGTADVIYRFRQAKKRVEVRSPEETPDET